MNRWLLVPCVVGCLAFVAFVGFARKPSATQPTSANKELLLSAEQLEQALESKWNEFQKQRTYFSRVIRPSESRYRPQVLVDVSQKAPMGQFAGVFELETAVTPSTAGDQNQENDAPAKSRSSASQKRTYPIFVDRRSGEAKIFSGDQWQDFDLWMASF